MIRAPSTALAVTAFVLLAAITLMLRPLTPVDETRYLAVAWEMHRSGDWLVPTKNFAPYSDKPPLLFWSINAVWALTGVHEVAARLVVPAYGALAIVLTGVLACRLWPGDGRIGARAAMALAGLCVFALSGSLTMFDVPLAVAVLLGLIALHRAGHAPDAGQGVWWPWAAFGGAVALGVLAKGPVILFHLLLPALLLPLWTRPRPWRAHLAHLGVGLLVALALVSLWLVPALITSGTAYRNAILWNQSAGRLASSFAHSQPWWFYLALIPVLIFPLGWSPTLWRAARRAPWRTDPGLRLCTIWCACAFVLFSVTSGKQVHYLVPELPALALIAARLTGQGQEGRPMAWWPAVAALGMIATLATLAEAGVVPLGRISPLIQPGSMLLAWALLVVTLCWIALRRRDLGGALILSLGLLFATNLLIGLTDVAQVYSARLIGERLAPRRDDGIAYVDKTYNAEFNFAARLTEPVATPRDRAALVEWMRTHPQGTIVGRVDLSNLPWRPYDTIPFRNRDTGLWRVADAPVSVLQE